MLGVLRRGAPSERVASGSISTTTTIVVGVGTLLYALYDTLGVYLVSSGRGKVFALTYPMEGWGWLIFIVATRELEKLNPGRAVAAWVVAFSCGAVFRLVSAIRVAGIARPSLSPTRRRVVFGFPARLGAKSTIVSYRLDQVLMGFISTRTQLGLYAVAVNGSEVLLYIAMATSMALTPAIARSAPEEIAPRALQAFRIVTLSHCRVDPDRARARALAAAVRVRPPLPRLGSVVPGARGRRRRLDDQRRPVERTLRCARSSRPVEYRVGRGAARSGSRSTSR